MTKIKDHVILLTGATSGIGEALAYALAAKGAKLIIASRRKEELERVHSECKNPESVAILPLDLSKVDAMAEKAKDAEQFFGPIDILINCGGISQRSKAIDTNIEVDRQIMEVNYFGTVALTKAVLPSMVTRKSGHHVVVTSATGIISTPLRSSYSAAKHALHGFFDALRAEHHRDGLKVSLILPGFVKTQISLNALVGDGQKQNTMDDAQANGMSAEECAAQIITAIEKDKEEVYIGGMKEKTAIYVKRFLPGVFSKMVRKLAVT
jgi:short-subunit dehydrogenase